LRCAYYFNISAIQICSWEKWTIEKVQAKKVAVRKKVTAAVKHKDILKRLMAAPLII